MVETVADPSSPFLDALLPVGARQLAAHANAVTCVLAGRTGPLRLECDGLRVDGEILLVRPGVVHAVALAERGADALFLNGLAFPFDVPLAQVLGGALAYLASDALRGDRDAMHEGQTFREFKRWSALQQAAQMMAGSALVTAAMDAGFADTAHVSRVSRQGFGLTPSTAIAGLGQ